MISIALHLQLIFSVYFLTHSIYDDVQVRPGPYLNVIIGPNATGKSTIVNAICLGLAGKTSILGRARDINAYIKNGKKKATLEITLYVATVYLFAVRLYYDS